MRIKRSPSTSPRRARRSAMAAAIASALACAAPAPAIAQDIVTQLAATEAARHVAVLESIVNGQPQGPSFTLVERGETIAIEASALRRWRIKIPANAPFEFEDRLFVALADLTGVPGRACRESSAMCVMSTSVLPPSVRAPSMPASESSCCRFIGSYPEVTRHASCVIGPPNPVPHNKHGRHHDA